VPMSIVYIQNAGFANAPLSTGSCLIAVMPDLKLVFIAIFPPPWEAFIQASLCYCTFVDPISAAASSTSDDNIADGVNVAAAFPIIVLQAPEGPRTQLRSFLCLGRNLIHELICLQVKARNNSQLGLVSLATRGVEEVLRLHRSELAAARH